MQFVAGVGLGSASLARHVFGWTFTSISGFSSAFAGVLQRSLTAQSANRYIFITLSRLQLHRQRCQEYHIPGPLASVPNNAPQRAVVAYRRKRLMSCRRALTARRSTGGLSGGLQGLAGGVSSGFTGLYQSPLAGYDRGSGSGLAVGLGRGLLGAVGLPLSGALNLVSSVSAGIAATTGISTIPRLRRPGRHWGKFS